MAAAPPPLLIFILLLSISIFPPLSAISFLKPKERIIVQNRTGDKRPIWVHCFSKEDDLGTHKLEYWQIFVMRFRPSFFKTTEFFCTVTWNNLNPVGTKTVHTIVVYNWDYDEYNCIPGTDVYGNYWPGCLYEIGTNSFKSYEGRQPWNVLSRRLIK